MIPDPPMNMILLVKNLLSLYNGDKKCITPTGTGGVLMAIEHREAIGLMERPLKAHTIYAVLKGRAEAEAARTGKLAG